jgi:hypothetical protein
MCKSGTVEVKYATPPLPDDSSAVLMYHSAPRELLETEYTQRE